jgi:hypothetical protein
MKRLSVVLAVLVVMMVGVSCLAAGQITDSHRQAAEELLVAMGMERTLEDSINSTLSMQLQQMPQLAQYEDVMRAFLYKYMSWEYLKEHIVQLYAEEFTEAELREITAFYRTETGKKLIELTPVLMNKGMAIGQQAVEEHLPELQQMVLQKMQGANSGQ